MLPGARNGLPGARLALLPVAAVLALEAQSAAAQLLEETPAAAGLAAASALILQARNFRTYRLTHETTKKRQTTGNKKATKRYS